METEIWKSHPYIVGIEVSTLGRVRSLDRIVPRKNGTYHIKGRVLKQFDNGNGYSYVHFSIDRKLVNRLVHRLVAETFIPNPDNFPQVNHKDCNTKNNNVKNLEFCTASYNNQYREKYGISTTESQGHPVFSINLTTLEVSHFRSQGEASRAIGVNQGNINNVLKDRIKQTGGFWFTNDDNNAVDTIKQKLYEIKHRATSNMRQSLNTLNCRKG